MNSVFKKYFLIGMAIFTSNWLQLNFLFAIQNETKVPIDWINKINDIRFEKNGFIDTKIKKLEILMDEYIQLGYQKDSIYARMAHRLGDYYRIQNDTDKAIQLFEEAVRINSSNSIYSEYNYLCETYCNMGLTYLNIDLEKAETYFEKSLEIFEIYPEKKGFVAALIHEHMASYYFGLGDYQKAIEIIDYAMATIPSITSTIDGNMLLLQKAYSLLLLEQMEPSRDIFERIIPVFEQEGVADEKKAVAFSIYSQFLETSDRISEAFDYLEKCLQIRKVLGYHTSVANTLYKMGSMLSDSNPKAAIVYFEEALGYSQGSEAEMLIPVIYNGLGVLFQKKDDHFEALRFFQKGLVAMGKNFENNNVFTNPDPAYFRNFSNDQIGFVLLKNKGESLLELYNEKPKEKGYLEASIKTHFLADKLVDQMRWNQNNSTSKEYWRGRTKSLYEKALETSILANNPEQVFYFLEKSRAVLLNDKLNELGAMQLLSDEEVKKETILKKSIDNLLKQIETNKSDKLGYQKLVKELYDGREEYKKFIKSLEAKYPVYYQYKYDTMVFSMQELRERIISNDQVYVSYFMGEENLFILKVGSEEPVLEMKPIGTIYEKINRFNELVIDKTTLNGNYSEFVELSHQIYLDLVYPLGLKGERIIFSMEEQVLPFEILITNESDPESFLLKNHPVSFTYSAQFLKKNKVSTRDKPISLFGLAPVDFFNANKASLLGSEVSLKKLAAMFSGSKVLSGQNASKQNFLNDYYKYSVVHVYSHADADNYGSEPMIYFSDDKLKLSEIPFDSWPKTDLIVLSACNTGVGKSIKGEGVMSLARGFASLGIASSVTTLWEVDDKATYAITEQFYQYLREGYFSDVALQKAKLDFINQQDRGNRIPYYWGGMILIGNSFQFEDVGNQYPYTLVRILVVFAVLVMIWFFWDKQKKRTINHPSRVKD
ncbi:Tetratricopeptide repeat-containing protein [Aquiflexum balticum DSM 16537]|uniref:Tetratricopeptide repeat-containing protein n=1 Tax=Aquiflexum balticum DSM 16537 TaxID=758820 RepID=A0A1W2H683_9BACT|nr:CHAT domain-containing tetratricopeptide repeat protein [Aquiflexum balticum]SMD44138.1 Tetratricopeptide repeat-containing protein [Aquiflexum balticum DSM 16537]